jgi:hypothetical protein
VVVFKQDQVLERRIFLHGANVRFSVYRLPLSAARLL